MSNKTLPALVSIEELMVFTKTYRKMRGWGLRELASATGLSINTLSRLERGHDLSLRNYQTLVYFFCGAAVHKAETASDRDRRAARPSRPRNVRSVRER